MKQMAKTSDEREKLIIPGIGEISVFQGAVPSTGGTVSIEEINKAFDKAVKEKIISPPLESSSNAE